MTEAVVERDKSAHRTLTSQLAEDLSWLERHSRRHDGFAAQAVQLRYAAALVRNVIGPFLDGQEPPPLHVTVVGGAGAGKSTVANFLAGTNISESNPQAGFTRHPIAFTSANGPINWPSHLGFLGPLKRLTEASPSNLDADVYQVRRVPSGDADTLPLLQKFVIWDGPDMTTWAATGYIPRLVEVMALADVIVYVASDERYNDEVPTQFLQMLIESGKAVVVCLTKMKEENAESFVQNFRREVMTKIKGGKVPVLFIPHLNAEELERPLEQAKRYQIPLINQVIVLGDPLHQARQRTVKSGLQHLMVNQERLLGVAKSDLTALQAWRDLVQEGQREFDKRYRQEYLTTERFARFDQALVRLLELLELPGVGRFVSGALYVVRTPYRLLKGLFTKAMQRPDAPPIPEQPVLERAMRDWMDLLRKEAARKAAGHPVWKHIDMGFDQGLAEKAHDRFEKGVREFHLSQADEADKMARAIYEDLEKNPVALNTLRGTKFAIEIGAIAGTVAAGGLNWFDLVLAPLAASVTQHLVEVFGKQYVDVRREQARTRQQALVKQHVSGPLAEWLSQWPATGGSDLERLQLALHRIPVSLKQLDDAVKKALHEK